MNPRALEIAVSWGKELSALLMVTPWVELALKNEPWNFRAPIACWALAATLVVWTSDIGSGRSGRLVGWRPLRAFVVVAVATGLTSASFGYVGSGRCSNDKFVIDVLCAVTGTLFTTAICWEFLRREARKA